MTSTSSTTTSNTSSTTTTSTGLLEALDTEWAVLRTSRRALHTARTWGRQLPDDHPLTEVIDRLDDLDQVLTATQHSCQSHRYDDDVLLALVRLARTDELAGRVVLQHLLPGLIAKARRYRSYRDQSDPLEIAVPMAWIAIRSYDVDRRCHHVASSLLSDAVFQAFRRPLRRMAATAEELRAPSSFSATASFDGPSTAVDEFVTVLRESREAGVPAHDLDLLRHLVRAGTPGAVARERQLTPRTIRNHRDRAVGRVRAAMAVAA